ncbi:MAG TPA: energy-converting NiFe hydrogenase A subunit EhaA [Methanobacterium sp.]|jgi:energy-converting hydrogenase A subunit A|nr:MAG: hypothetical protein FGO69_03800 [Methanobacterium sp.]HOI71512.1 energy-converting NiFe hydrogenase A subunit EhaA [Methanobacterium sp.]
MIYIVYIIAIVSAMVLGLILKLPLLPEQPIRKSWTTSVVFPTAVLALGFTAMVSKLGYLTSTNMDYLIALAIGVLTAIFSKYMLERFLPPQNSEESSDESQEASP